MKPSASSVFLLIGDDAEHELYSPAPVKLRCPYSPGHCAPGVRATAGGVERARRGVGPKPPSRMLTRCISTSLSSPTGVSGFEEAGRRGVRVRAIIVLVIFLGHRRMSLTSFVMPLKVAAAVCSRRVCGLTLPSGLNARHRSSIPTRSPSIKGTARAATPPSRRPSRKTR